MQTILDTIKTWSGPVEIDGTRYDNISSVESVLDERNSVKHIKLLQADKTRLETTVDRQEYKITVKQYMTRKASADFDFMLKWNNDNPMPYRTMIGTIEKETRGMVYMNLRADIYAERVYHCMRCGKKLTNPVSQYFGIGPECGGHNYVHPFDTDEELKEAVNEYRKQLQEVTWSGWIIRSSILEKEKI